MSRALEARQDFDRQRLWGSRSKTAEMGKGGARCGVSDLETRCGVLGSLVAQEAGRELKPGPGKCWMLGRQWGSTEGFKAGDHGRARNSAIFSQNVRRPVPSTPCCVFLFIL